MRPTLKKTTNCDGIEQGKINSSQEHIQILEREAEFQVWEYYTRLHSTATEANCQPIPSKTKKKAAGAEIQSLAAELRLMVHN
jgi:hypothetical protein